MKFKESKRNISRWWQSPWVIAILTLLLGLLVSVKMAQIDTEQRLSDDRSQATSELATIRASLEAVVNSVFSATSGLVSVISYQGEISPDLFNSLAAQTIKNHPHIRNIAIAPDNTVAMIYPLTGNERVLGLRYETISEQYQTVQQAMQTGRPVLAGPLRLVQGGEAFILRSPVFDNQQTTQGITPHYWGMVSVVANIDAILDASGLRAATTLEIGLRHTVNGKPGALIWGNQVVFDRQPVSMTIAIPGGEWQLAAVRKGGWPMLPTGTSPVFYVGLLNSLLLAGFAWTLAARHRRMQDENRQLLQEIRERTRAEEQLQCSQQNLKQAQFIIETERSRLRILLQTIPALVWMKNTDGVYLACNAHFERFFDATESEILGKTDYDFVDSEQADFFREHDRKAIAAGQPSVNEEWVTYADDGHRELLETIKTPVHDAEGRLIGVLGIARNITEHRQAEDELKNERLRFKNLVDSVDGIVWEADAESFAFTYVSQQAERLLGYPVAEWYQPEFWKDHLHPDDSEWAPTFCSNQTLSRQDHSFEYRFMAQDGHIVWLHDIVTVVEENGRPRWLRGIMVDTTGKKLEEAEKQKLEAQLRQAQKMEAIGRLAGGVAHDFNNKLAVILGYVEMALRAGSASERYVTYLKQVLKTAGQARDITRQLLTFSRQEMIAPRTLDLNDVVRDSQLGLCRFIGEDISFEVRLSENLWPINMDPSQIDQVIMNLVVNARDAMEDGGRLIVETQNVIIDEAYSLLNPDAAAGEYVQLTVNDTGCGMDRETQQHIFEPFYTTKMAGKGTGLGLATIYGIITQSNGFVNVYSEPGVGTTFRIYFPRCDKPHNVMETSEPSIHLDVSATILLVEDDPSVRDMAADILREIGYNILIAATSQEAIAICSTDKCKPDLLLTDVIMPDMNGRELAHRIEALCPCIKVLFMSGYTADIISKKGILEEGLHFIQKPFSRANLHNQIQQILKETA